MFFPIGDDNSGRQTTPVVNYISIAADALVFVFFQGQGNFSGRAEDAKRRRGHLDAQHSD
ncbi:MAG: hypothetical protein ACJ754_10760 [Pyrinomonadaceae bacterium]